MPKLKCALVWGMSNTMPKHIDIYLIFEIYGLRLFHISPEDIGLTMFARHLS